MLQGSSGASFKISATIKWRKTSPMRPMVVTALQHRIFKYFVEPLTLVGEWILLIMKLCINFLGSRNTLKFYEYILTGVWSHPCCRSTGNTIQRLSLVGAWTLYELSMLIFCGTLKFYKYTLVGVEFRFVTALQPTIFHRSYSYSVQLLTSVRAWTLLLIMGSLCSFNRVFNLLLELGGSTVPIFWTACWKN